MQKLKACLHDDVIKSKHFPGYCPVVRETTGDRWIPLTEASDAEFWCFLWSASEKKVEKTTETPVICDAMVLVMTSL